MRWLNFVLALLVIVVPAIAGPGDGSTFGFNPGKQQVASAMAQPADDPVVQTNIGGEGRLVPGKALLLSGIVPGAGQFYAKSPIWAAAFLAMEVGAWAGVAMYHGEGMDKEDEFIAYADDHWTYGMPDVGGSFDSYLGYEYWCATVFGKNGINEVNQDDIFTGDQTAWNDLTWNERHYYLPVDGFTHELDPNDMDQQYYEMIGKYGQFATGWDDYTEDDQSTWQTNSAISPNRDNYLNMRKDSNDALDMSKNFTMVVLANHLLSALHAGFTVSRHNKNIAQEQTIEGAFNLVPKRYNDEHIAMGVLSIRF